MWQMRIRAGKGNKMIHFDINTLIYRPVPQVFAFVAMPENDFQWQYGTLASAQISTGKIGLGTLIRTVSHFLDRRIEAIYEVTEFDPNRSYGFKSVSGPVETHTLYTFAMASTGTRIALFVETDPKDSIKPEGAIIVKKFKKQYKENLVMLKNLLEAYRIARQ
jgi:hypothetical protein